MTIALFWLIFATAVGVIASERGRSGFGWFLLALLISPLIAVIVVALGGCNSYATRRSDFTYTPTPTGSVSTYRSDTYKATTVCGGSGGAYSCTTKTKRR